jgi:hypothetical protein
LALASGDLELREEWAIGRSYILEQAYADDKGIHVQIYYIDQKKFDKEQEAKRTQQGEL